jgi:hypothetical protein
MGRSITTSNTTASPEIGNEVAQIYSAAGYQAGDLIYNSSGVYGTATTSTATFPITATQTFASGNTNYSLFDVVEGNNAGTQFSNPADLLTNGNTVVVWIQGTYTGRTSSAAYFKIIDSSNNEVVAPTIIATGLANIGYAQIGVVALTGGGFAVAFRGASNILFRAVYSNTGAVVYSPTSTTYALNTTYLTLRMTATTDGKFAVIYVLVTSNVWFLDIYNADGSLGSHLTLGATATNNNYSAGIAARNNGGTHEIGFCYPSAGTSLRYGVRDTAGTVRLAEAAFAAADILSTDMCLNSTDNNFVLPYTSVTLGGLFYARINTTPAFVTGVTILAGVDQAPVFAKGLSTGGFFVLAGGNTSVAGKSVPYFIYNGTYTKVSANPGYIRGISSQNYNGYSATESGGVLTVYGATQSSTETSGQPTYTAFMGMIYRFKVNISTYLQVPANTTYVTTNAVTNTAALPAAEVVRATATPKSASFLAASTSSQSTTLPVTSGTTGFVVPQTTIDTLLADSMDCDTLPNGNIVIVYRISSTYAVKMAVYTQAGVLVNNTTVGTGTASTNQYQSAYVAALPNGKIVVVYYSASTTLSYAIYSSTFTLLNSGTLIATVYGWGANSHAYIAGLSDNRFVVVYPQTSSSRFAYAVYDDTGTVVQGQTNDLSSSVAATALKVAGTTDGGFAYYFYAAVQGVNWVNHITKVGLNNYAEVANSITSVGSAGSNNNSNAIVVAPDNTIYVYTPADAASTRLYKFNPSVIILDSPPQAGSSIVNNSNYASVTITGSGQIVSYNQLDSSGTYYVYTGNQTTSTTTITTSNYTSTGRALVSMTGGYDNTAVIAMLNNAQQPTFFIINTAAITYTSTITTGVTASNPITLSQYSTPPYYLVGVSQTAAPAGGVGTVQTNGSAVLNSNYPASTTNQYFDFDTPTTFGVKGSISGRNVTMTRT